MAYPKPSDWRSSWISRMLASIHLFPLSRIQTTIIFLFLLFLAGYVGAKIWKHLRVFLREHWKLILGLELVYLSLWFIFLIIRIYHPAITVGEKPMNISVLTSVYRTSWFPPKIHGSPISGSIIITTVMPYLPLLDALSTCRHPICSTLPDPV